MTTHDFLDRADIGFLIFDWLKVETLSGRPIFAEHNRGTFESILDLSATLSIDTFATHYKQADREEPRLDKGRVELPMAIKTALDRYREAGFFAADLGTEFGGLQLPMTVSAASFAFFAAANIATAAYPMLTTANARLLTCFGTPEQIDHFAKPQIEGRWFGTMCLSEPDAGSSLADITVRAIPDGFDVLGERYRLTGTKMWISGGDHELSENIVHLVLAKIAASDGSLPSGTKGISLFAVPKYLSDGQRNDIVTSGLNHKLGYRGTVNCVLSFGDKGGAVGWLIGKAGQGLGIMFHMMNEARIMVGLGAAAIASRAYRQSLDYARERRQGRAPGAGDGASPAPIIAHADVRRMLLTQKALSEGGLALVLKCARLVDDLRSAPDAAAREHAGALLQVLTPVAKTWPAEFGLIVNDLAIQIHGGYGYTRDFDVEQLWRDNRLNTIHEGTTGIQALDLVGRKIIRDEGRGFALAERDVAATIARARAEARLDVLADRLSDYWRELAHCVSCMTELGAQSRALDNATAFLAVFGHGIVGWLWLDVVLAALAKGDSARIEGKFWACRFFIENELPRMVPFVTLVAEGRDVASTIPDTAF